MYKRVLLKLSGEQLGGKFDSGIDSDFCKWLASEIKQVPGGTDVIVMIGGGNYARGAQLAGNGIKHVTAHHIGMLATMMNALALADIFTEAGLPAKALSNVKADQIIDQFTHRRADNHLAKGRVVIVGGGTGRPFVTTDTAAVGLALELGCEVVLKATKVDGVYDKDPEKFANAVKYDTLRYEQSLSDGAIKIMDKAALGLAMEHAMPVIIFNATLGGNIAKAVAGETIGTKISE